MVNRSLPPEYYALTEKSLQIQLSGENPFPTRPDIAIFQERSTPPRSQSEQMMPPTLEVPMMPSDDYFVAVEIYHAPSNRFVTRIELLSPINKTQHLQNYRDMRQAMFKLGVNIVEVDYLHETPTIFRDLLPDYTQKANGAYPFAIAVSNPYREKLSLFCFHVEEALPTLVIPLNGEDSFRLNFGEAYNITFEDDRRAHMLIDYEQLPLHFDKYAPFDQEQIRVVMESITSTKNP